MARVKIAEFTAKLALFPAFGLAYHGVALTSTDYPAVLSHLPRDLRTTNLVLKVDQGIKKRGKQGLVKVNVTVGDVPALIKSWSKLGWTNFLLEPVIEHSQSVERYLALERVREGWQISFSESGGVDIESSWDQIQTTTIPYPESNSATLSFLRASSFQLPALFSALDKLHAAFLEINPILLRRGQLIPLDMACEVDSTASPLPSFPDRPLSTSETAIVALDASTPASLKFKLLNPQGKIWMLLSGGGASLVLADEVADLGLGHELANYGEYSGAPNGDDVYSYTKIILSQILKSKIINRKSIIIAGGVANFTDVAQTFRGLIRALAEQAIALKRAKVKVFVRRGGPHEEQGLSLMRTFLTQSGLLGSVHGHETPLTQVVTEAKHYLDKLPRPSSKGPKS